MHSRNITVYIFYAILPIISFFYKYIISITINDRIIELYLISIIFFGFSLKLYNNDNFYRFNFNKYIFVFFIFVFYLILKILYYQFIIPKGEFYIFPFLMEMKLLVFMILSLSMIVLNGYPDLNSFVKGGIFLSLILIIDVLIKSTIFGSLQRPSVISESNYDGFLILLSYIALIKLNKVRYKNRIIFLFAVATILTQSKTGIGAFILINFWLLWRRPTLIKALGFFVFAVLSGFVVFQRLTAVDGIESVDRIVMWVSYIELTQHMPLSQLLFGSVPGVPLAQGDDLLSWFVKTQGDRLSISGLHAFNYHAFMIRFLLTWGFIPTVAALFYVLFKAIRAPSLIPIFILVSVQSLTMGVFYLSTIAVPTTLLYLLLSKLSGEERHIERRSIKI